MKTTKQIYKVLLTSIFIVVIINTSIAQERKESFEKNYKISSTGNFNFSCYDTDLKVNTWNKGEVKIMGEIIIVGGDPDDQEKLIEVFKNPEVSSTPSSLRIETDLAKNTIIIGPFKKITLVSGKTIRIDKYKVKYTLWIPESINFDLKSKYNNIDIATLKGNVNFNLYEVDLTLVSFNMGDFDMKYSSAELGKGEKARFDIYECEIEAKEINEIIANTKYSEYKFENVGKLAINSYEDEFEFQNLKQGITGQAKYSNINIASNVDLITIDVYETDIEVLNVKKVEYTSKYSKFRAQNVDVFKCNNLYEAKIFAATVGEFSIQESKYDNVSFQKITKSIEVPSAYELDLNVGAVESSFEKFYGNFRYGTINLPLSSNLEFSLDFETTYGNVDFPKDRIKVKDLHIKESNKHSFEGATSENPKCSIKFKAYDANIDLD